MRAQHTRMAEDAAAVGLDFHDGSGSSVGKLLLTGRPSCGAARVRVDLEAAVTDRVMRAWYSEGAAIGDARDARAARGGGRPRRGPAVRAPPRAGDDFGIDVRTDEALAAQIGISAVPMFVLDQKYGVSGAQPVEVLLQAIRQVWDLQGTEPEVAAGGGCGGGCCGGGCGSGGAEEPAADTGGRWLRVRRGRLRRRVGPSPSTTVLSAR